MEVILKEDVSGLGKAGDLVNVRDGHARNFLIPQNKAVVADPKNIKMLEHQKKMVEAHQVKIKKGAEYLATKVSGLSLTISRKAGEEDKIFGSVTTKDIVEALGKEGILIDRRQVNLKEPIKQIGVFDIEIKLHSDVNGTVKVWVVKE